MEIEEIKNDDDIGKVLKLFLTKPQYRENESLIQDLVDHVEGSFDLILYSKFVYIIMEYTETAIAYHMSIHQGYIKEKIDTNDLIEFIRWGNAKKGGSYNRTILLKFCAAILETVYINNRFDKIKGLTVEDFLHYSLSELLTYKNNIQAQIMIEQNQIKTIVEVCSNCFDSYEEDAFPFFIFVKECCMYMLLDFEDIEIIVRALKKNYIEKANDISLEFSSEVELVTDTLFLLGKVYEVLIFAEMIGGGEVAHQHVFENCDVGRTLLTLSLHCIDPKENFSYDSMKYSHYPKYLKEMSNLYFFPFQNEQRPFNKTMFDSLYRNVNEEKIKQIKNLSKEIFELRIDYKNKTQSEEKKKKFENLLNEVVSYITERIKG